MKNTFTFYSDPAHGWLKVPKQLLRILGITNIISHYSYDRNGFVYLEEDLDLSRFMGAFKDKFGVDVKIYSKVPSKKASSIRSYERYDAHYERNRGHIYNQS